MAPRGPPRRAQDGPNTAPRRPLRPQNGPRWPPWAPRNGPRCPQTASRAFYKGPKTVPRRNCPKLRREKNVLWLPSARDLKVSSMAFLRVPRSHAVCFPQHEARGRVVRFPCRLSRRRVVCLSWHVPFYLGAGLSSPVLNVLPEICSRRGFGRRIWKLPEGFDTDLGQVHTKLCI